MASLYFDALCCVLTPVWLGDSLANMESKLARSLALPFIFLTLIAVQRASGDPSDTNAAAPAIRIALVGDSTMADYLEPGDVHRGWGQLFPEFVDPARSQANAGGMKMPAELGKQRGHALESVEQMEGRNAATGSLRQGVVRSVL